ncbi:MAG TPA: hypothetical protein PL157_15330 [Acidobacteriota bacterium]|jgi:hypothetical protein|nr:hypothetical protein [Acidobacteriota bacterium]
MKKWIFLIATHLFLTWPIQAQEAHFEFPVEHIHTLKNRRGTLIISSQGIEYRTSDPKEKKDARRWLFMDLWQIKIASPTEIELATYEDQRRLLGRDRIFKFHLMNKAITPEISTFLVGKTSRPVVMSIFPSPDESPVFTVTVKHLHMFGGCEGVLKVFHNHIVYESLKQPNNSRLWKFSDIQDFSHPTRYSVSLISYEDQFGGPERTYNFQLKEDFPTGANEYLWERVYPMKYPSNPKAIKSGLMNTPTTVQEKNH